MHTYVFLMDFFITFFLLFSFFSKRNYASIVVSFLTTVVFFLRSKGKKIRKKKIVLLEDPLRRSLFNIFITNDNFQTTYEIFLRSLSNRIFLFLFLSVNFSIDFLGGNYFTHYFISFQLIERRKCKRRPRKV